MLTFMSESNLFFIACSISRRLYHRRSPLPLLPPSLLSAEPLAYMRLAQEDWEGRMRRGVNTLCTELGTPLAKEVYMNNHLYVYVCMLVCVCVCVCMCVCGWMYVCVFVCAVHMTLIIMVPKSMQLQTVLFRPS